MKLIVGLGNPGSKYKGTRHNIGREVVQETARFNEAIFAEKKKFKAKIAETIINEDKIYYELPETFMNHSGEAVQAIAQFYKIQNTNILIVQDEMDFPPFQFAFARGGGAGGHNGIKSIYQHLGQDITRLRIGIGRPEQNMPTDAYVLQKFGVLEKMKLSLLKGKMIDAILDWTTEGLTKAMDMWNGVH